MNDAAPPGGGLEPDDVRALRAGLRADPPRLPAWLFYDAEGSALFSKICTLPEYYQTRTEVGLLAAHAADIVAGARPIRLAELGSGDASKIGRLIDAMSRDEGCWDVSLLDVDGPLVRAAAARLEQRWPMTRVRGLEGRYPRDLDMLGPGGRRLVCFFGSTIGNLTYDESVDLLSELRAVGGAGDRLLVGFDLVKDRAILEAAYNDSEGVTAAFSLNMLRRLARLGGGAVPVDAFVHDARFHEEDPRIEMRLVARRPVRLALPALDIDRTLAAGEAIVTERCAKHTRASVDALAAAAGLRVEAWYTDAQAWFALALLG